MQTVTFPGTGAAAPGGERCFAATLPATQNAIYQVATGGATSIGFYMRPPTGGKVRFEGSWCGNVWEPFTVRQMGAHGYVTSAEETESYIGSCATLNFVRFCVERGGSGTGDLRGRFSNATAILEGIEHGYAPHKIGAEVKAEWFTYNSVVTNGTIAFPDHTYHKLIVTDIHFTVADAASIVCFSEGSIAAGNLIFRGNAKPTGGNSLFYPISFTLPHVFQGTNVPLCISSTGAATVDGVVHYYESE